MIWKEQKRKWNMLKDKDSINTNIKIIQNLLDNLFNQHKKILITQQNLKIKILQVKEIILMSHILTDKKSNLLTDRIKFLTKQRDLQNLTTFNNNHKATENLILWNLQESLKNIIINSDYHRYYRYRSGKNRNEKNQTDTSIGQYR